MNLQRNRTAPHLYIVPRTNELPQGVTPLTAETTAPCRLGTQYGDRINGVIVLRQAANDRK
jgi:hypothetical protein